MSSNQVGNSITYPLLTTARPEMWSLLSGHTILIRLSKPNLCPALQVSSWPFSPVLCVVRKVTMCEDKADQKLAWALCSSQKLFLKPCSKKKKMLKISWRLLYNKLHSEIWLENFDTYFAVTLKKNTLEELKSSAPQYHCKLCSIMPYSDI